MRLYQYFVDYKHKYSFIYNLYALNFGFDTYIDTDYQQGKNHAAVQT